MDQVHIPHHRHNRCGRFTNALYGVFHWCQNNSRTISAVAGSIISVAAFYARIQTIEKLSATNNQLSADAETMEAAQTALKAVKDQLSQCSRALEVANTLLRARNITTLY